jgi:hypothetical protein
MCMLIQNSASVATDRLCHNGTFDAGVYALQHLLLLVLLLLLLLLLQTWRHFGPSAERLPAAPLSDVVPQDLGTSLDAQARPAASVKANAFTHRCVSLEALLS